MERHQIAFARAKNAYEHIKSLCIRQCDIKDLVDELLLKKNRHNNKQHNDKSRLKSDVTTTSISDKEVDCSDIEQSQKRPRADPMTTTSTTSVECHSIGMINSDSKELMNWSSALSAIESQYGLSTFDDTQLHVPLQQV
jgi:hypothetical protein